MSLSPIPVEQQPAAGCAANAVWTGNLEPLRHELRHALEKLVCAGETTVLDLRALPFSPQEDAALTAWLGVGEVRAELSVLGRSEVQESAFAGIWLVTHFTESGAVCGRYLEVTRCPQILQTPEADLADALSALDASLASGANDEHIGDHHE
jgi:hydrogenase-1 operon protein HyaF